MERVKTHLSVPKIIRDKRPTFKQLIIRNYKPPKEPLYTRDRSNLAIMDLFGMLITMATNHYPLPMRDGGSLDRLVATCPS